MAAAVIAPALASVAVSVINGIFGRRRQKVPPPIIQQVEKEIIKIIDVSKDAYEANQQFIADIANAKFSSFAGCDLALMMIGPAGFGKTTVLKEFLDVDVTPTLSAGHGTKLLEIKRSNKLNVDVCDCVGADVCPSIVGKLFLLYMIQGYFPDYWVYPAANDRVVDVIKLGRFIDCGLIKIQILPWSAKVYYTMASSLQETLEESAGMSPQQAAPIAAKKAKEKAFEKSTKNDIESYVEISGWSGSVTMFKFEDPAQIENGWNPPSGSMREAFIAAFFKDSKWITVPYEQHMAQLADPTNQTALLRAAIYSAVGALKKNCKLEGTNVTNLHEINFLKPDL